MARILIPQSVIDALLESAQYVASCVAEEIDDLADDEPVSVTLTAKGLRDLFAAVTRAENS